MGELSGTMSLEEFDTWVAFHALKAEEQKRAMEEAKAGAKSQRGRRR